MQLSAIASEQDAAARCPCCGHVQEGRLNPMQLATFLPFSGNQRAMLDVLALRFGRLVKTDEIAAAIWRGVKEGGPLDERGQIHVMAWQMRPKLLRYGFELKGFPGNAGGYRLMWVEP